MLKSDMGLIFNHRDDIITKERNKNMMTFTKEFEQALLEKVHKGSMGLIRIEGERQKRKIQANRKYGKKRG